MEKFKTLDAVVKRLESVDKAKLGKQLHRLAKGKVNGREVVQCKSKRQLEQLLSKHVSALAKCFTTSLPDDFLSSLWSEVADIRSEIGLDQRQDQNSGNQESGSTAQDNINQLDARNDSTSALEVKGEEWAQTAVAGQSFQSNAIKPPCFVADNVAEWIDGILSGGSGSSVPFLNEACEVIRTIVQMYTNYRNAVQELDALVDQINSLYGPLVRLSQHPVQGASDHLRKAFDCLNEASQLVQEQKGSHALVKVLSAKSKRRELQGLRSELQQQIEELCQILSMVTAQNTQDIRTYTETERSRISRYIRNPSVADFWVRCFNYDGAPVPPHHFIHAFEEKFEDCVGDILIEKSAEDNFCWNLDHFQDGQIDPTEVKLYFPPGRSVVGATKLLVQQVVKYQVFDAETHYWELVGRTIELDFLLSALDADAATAVICADGGLGKSSLAWHAAKSFQEKLPAGACWVPLRNVRGVGTFVAIVANELRVSLEKHDTLNLCRQVKKEAMPGRSLLLVLDNIEDLLRSDEAGPEFISDTICKLLKAKPDMRVLLTSRDRINDSAVGSVLTLSNLSLDAAAEVAKLHNPLSEASEEFAQAFDNNPLEIATAAAQVFNGHVSEREILQQTMLQKGSSLEAAMARSFDDEGELRDLTRLSVFPGSFDDEAAASVLDVHDAHEAHNRLEKLKMYLSFDHSSHRWQLHNKYSSIVQQRGKQSDLVEGHLLFVQYFAQMLSTLNDDYNSHLQRSALSRLDEELLNVSSLTLTLAFIDENRYVVQARGREQQCIDILATLLDGSSLLGIRLLLQSRKMPLSRVLCIMQALGAQETHIAHAKHAYAVTLSDNYELEESKKLMEAALSTHKDRLRARHPRVAGELNNIAMVHRRKNELAEALEKYYEALNIFKENFGLLHPNVANTLNNIGKVHREKSELAEALEKYEEALSIKRANFESRHPEIANTLNNIAIVHRERSELAEALEKYEEALSIKRENFGSRHPDVAMALNNIGEVHREKNELAEALENSKEALSIFKENFGSRHPNVAMALNNMGVVHKEKNELAEALEKYKEALSIKTENFESRHPKVADTLNNMGEVHREKNELAEALENSKEALSIFKENFGSCHPKVAMALSNMGEVHREKNEFAEALEKSKEALSIFKENFGSRHPKVVDTLNNIGEVHKEKNALAEAKRTFNESLQVVKSMFGGEHAKAADALNSLANTEQKLGEVQNARAHIEKALSVLEMRKNFDEAKRSAFIHTLGTVEREEGDLIAARKNFEDALGRIIDSGGDDAEVRANFASLLDLQGDLEEAERVRNYEWTAEVK